MITQHLTPADYQAVPWKNGKGTTLELASEQSAQVAKSADFRWRISIADMVESAEFSSFTGVGRILTVIEGHGLRLEGESFEKPLSCMPYKPVAFTGSVSCFGRLLDGSVKNFNVMVDETSAHAAVAVREVPARIRVRGDIDFFYVPPTQDDLCFTVGDAIKRVASGESLLVQEPAGQTLDISQVTTSDTVPNILHVSIRYLPM